MKRPLLRFVVLGVLLFVGDLWWTLRTRADAPLAPPGTALADDELLFREALARGYHESDGVVRMRLARNMRFAGADEARSDAELVDEAIALDMHATDLVVRRRMIQKVTLLLQSRGRREEPTEGELLAHLEANRNRWYRPARASVTHLYFKDETRATGAREGLPAPPDPDDLALRRRADPLPIPHHLARHAERELAKLLGPGFATEVMALPVGGWHGPVASAYGAHLVWVHDQTARAEVPLDAVRTEVRESLLARRGEESLQAWLAGVRERQSLPRPGQAQGRPVPGEEG